MHSLYRGVKRYRNRAVGALPCRLYEALVEFSMPLFILRFTVSEENRNKIKGPNIFHDREKSVFAPPRQLHGDGGKEYALFFIIAFISLNDT